MGAWSAHPPRSTVLIVAGERATSDRGSDRSLMASGRVKGTGRDDDDFVGYVISAGSRGNDRNPNGRRRLGRLRSPQATRA